VRKILSAKDKEGKKLVHTEHSYFWQYLDNEGHQSLPENKAKMEGCRSKEGLYKEKNLDNG
jgi:hypothetical protein